jgi:hypothetical protein
VSRTRIACGLWPGCADAPTDGLHDERCSASGQTTIAVECGPIDTPTYPGSRQAREHLNALTEEYAHPARLGCELSAHRDLGFCAMCARPGASRLAQDTELMGWRLLAIAQRGVARWTERDQVHPIVDKAAR